MDEQAAVIVTHRQQPTPSGYTRVYAGRPSVYGNPYRMDTRSDAERERVIEQYRHYLRADQARGGPLTRAVSELAQRVRGGERLCLECFCAPKPCHADVLADAVLAQVRADG